MNYYKNKLLTPAIAALLGITTLMASNAFAAEHKIEMLNNGADGPMTFSPAFLKAAKGDTVRFIAKDKGHNVGMHVAPKGVRLFKGKIDEEITLKLDTEGVYVYDCDPHMALAMVGVIQVGEPTNLEDAKKEQDSLTKKFFANKDRLTKLMAQVK